MKHLTPIYLTMMNAFVNSSDERVQYYKYLDNISMYREYRTLMLSAGRQNGKSVAITQFVNDWLNLGNDVVYISPNGVLSREAKEKINDLQKINYLKLHHIPKAGNIFYTTLRAFLSNSGSYLFREHTLKNCLVIVEDLNIKNFDLNSLYTAYNSNITTTNSDYPFFFIVGMF